MIEEFSHTLADGTMVKVQITRPEPEPSEPTEIKMCVGASFDSAPEAYDSGLERWGHVGACRVFSKTTPPKWDDWRITKLLSHNVMPFVSWKTFNPDGATAWLDTMPDPTVMPGVFATYMHEPEPKGVPPQEYKVHFKELHQLIKAHPNGNRVMFGPVLTRQWTENTAGRSYSIYDPLVGDFFGVDMYVNTWEDRYPDPVEFCRYAGQYARNSGRPFWVPELGAVKTTTDPTGTGLALWLTQTLETLHALDAQLVLWWDDLGTPSKEGATRDFRLTDEATQIAFKRALREFNGV